MNPKEIHCEGVGWLNLAQDSVQWQVLANTIMNIQVPKKGGEFLDQLSNYQLCKKEFSLQILFVGYGLLTHYLL
jgi:hypothetical protein